MGAVTSRTLSVGGPQDLNDVVFRIVDQTRYTEVLDLLYTNFHTDEPMSRALRIFDGTNRIPEADEYTLRALSENLSLMAVDSLTNKVRLHSIHLGKCLDLSPEGWANQGQWSKSTKVQTFVEKK